MKTNIQDKVGRRLRCWCDKFMCTMVYTPYLSLFGRRDKRKLKYDISLCLIFNNEAPYLREWLDYHLTIGVDHFYLYNDNSTDDYLSVIQPYIEQGAVTLVQWQHRQAQARCYRHCLENFKDETRWIGYIDADEFVCPLKATSIKEWIKDYESYPAVHVSWLQFGTDGIIEHDFSRNVIEQYFACWRGFYMGKTFVNTQYEVTNWDSQYFHHKSYMHFRVFGLACSVPAVSIDKIVRPMRVLEEDKKHRTKANIQINHYYTKAWNTYAAKMKKPDVFFENNPKSYERLLERELHCMDRDYSILRFLQKMRLMQGIIK